MKRWKKKLNANVRICTQFVLSVSPMHMWMFIVYHSVLYREIFSSFCFSWHLFNNIFGFPAVLAGPKWIVYVACLLCVSQIKPLFFCSHDFKMENGIVISCFAESEMNCYTNTFYMFICTFWYFILLFCVCTRFPLTFSYMLYAWNLHLCCMYVINMSIHVFLHGI